jgi:hypothetical protein
VAELFCDCGMGEVPHEGENKSVCKVDPKLGVVAVRENWACAKKLTRGANKEKHENEYGHDYTVHLIYYLLQIIFIFILIFIIYIFFIIYNFRKYYFLLKSLAPDKMSNFYLYLLS